MAEEERTSKAYLENIGETFSRSESRCTVITGKPEEMILQAAGADVRTLIAMATHGRSGVRRWLLGSVTEKVLRATHNPLLLIRARSAADVESDVTLKSVIVPLDGSSLAESALPTVLDFARELALEVILLRAYGLPTGVVYGSEDYLPHHEELLAGLREEAREYLNGKVAELRSRELERLLPMVAEGSGAEEIIKAARDTPNSLVVMCTHGRSGVERWVLGSVTEKVVRHSGTPILVLRSQQTNKG
jgi:nucleotide-binding universal stress UspA family protein